MSRLRWRLARLLVGRFVTIPETEPDKVVVVLVLADDSAVVLAPTKFRMKSRSKFPQRAYGMPPTPTFERSRHLTTFVGIVER
jgi:hypothetical protein